MNTNQNNLAIDLEKQETALASLPEECPNDSNHAQLTVVVLNVEPCVPQELTAKSLTAVDSNKQQLPIVVSPKKGNLSRTSSSHEQCRICQQDKEEILIDLGCHCRGGLAKAHRTCVETWFHTRGSNICEICQDVAANVPPPQNHPSTNYWVWRIDPTFRTQDRDRGCFSPLWVAFAILIGGLLLDVLISITLGVSALPVNIIIGVIVVLGLGTALRLALEFCHEWSLRRVVQRVETDINMGYHPAL